MGLFLGPFLFNFLPAHFFLKVEPNHRTRDPMASDDENEVPIANDDLNAGSDEDAAPEDDTDGSMDLKKPLIVGTPRLSRQLSQNLLGLPKDQPAFREAPRLLHHG